MSTSFKTLGLNWQPNARCCPKTFRCSLISACDRKRYQILTLMNLEEEAVDMLLFVLTGVAPNVRPSNFGCTNKRQMRKRVRELYRSKMKSQPGRLRILSEEYDNVGSVALKMGYKQDWLSDETLEAFQVMAAHRGSQNLGAEVQMHNPRRQGSQPIGQHPSPSPQGRDDMPPPRPKRVPRQLEDDPRGRDRAPRVQHEEPLRRGPPQPRPQVSDDGYRRGPPPPRTPPEFSEEEPPELEPRRRRPLSKRPPLALLDDTQSPSPDRPPVEDARGAKRRSHAEPPLAPLPGARRLFDDTNRGRDHSPSPPPRRDVAGGSQASSPPRRDVAGGSQATAQASSWSLTSLKKRRTVPPQPHRPAVQPIDDRRGWFRENAEGPERTLKALDDAAFAEDADPSSLFPPPAAATLVPTTPATSGSLPFSFSVWNIDAVARGLRIMRFLGKMQQVQRILKTLSLRCIPI